MPVVDSNNRKMISNRYFLLVLFVSVFLPVRAIQDYCSLKTYDAHGSHLQFTKEPSYEEFAVVGRFKGLHCCAKGYSSIEWFKDGRPYPWSSTLSQLILYPQSANQTIYTTSVSQDDAGNYTCLLKNESVVFVHTIHLTVYEKVPDDPKITYISRNVELAVGEPLRLFCEAFVGKALDLPDAINEITWTKSGASGSIDLDPRFRQEEVNREENQTYGTYLMTEKITKDDYGEYICKVSKPGKSMNLHVFVGEKIDKIFVEQNAFMNWTRITVLFSLIFALLFTTYRLINRYLLPVRITVRNNFGPFEENDGKQNDVLILHSASDSEIARGVLLPVLETKYSYKCEVVELPENMASWYTHLLDAATRCRRILLVLSPACVNNQWDTNTIYNALKQLQALGPQLSCIALMPLPTHANESKNAQGETLSSLLKTIRVLQWGKFRDKFWLSILLELPPKRSLVEPQSTANQNKRLNDDCNV